MARKDLVNNIKITLPLIALCLPLSFDHYLKAENTCPYETYIRLEGKCLNISEQGLNKITSELDTPGLTEVNKEIEEVSQELGELGAEIVEFCVEEQPETTTQLEIMEDICQY